MQTNVNDSGDKPSRALRLVCLIGRAHLDLAQQSNSFDRQTIGFHAVTLTAATVFALIVWSSLFATFMSVVAAVGLAALVALLIYLVDSTAFASDSEPAGILRSGRLPPAWWGRLIIRCSIAFGFSLLTATGAMLVLFSGSINQRLQMERTQQNLPIQEAYAAKEQALKARLIAPLEAEVAGLQNERDDVTKNLQTATATRAEQQQRASKARIQLGREVTGGLPGYVPGYGPRAEEAQRQQREADLLLKSATDEIKSYETQLADIGKRIAEATHKLASAGAVLDAKIRELELAKVADPSWMPARIDPLMEYMALRTIESDPVRGPEASWLHHLASIFMLLIELCPFILQNFFGVASVYRVRHNEHTKYEAEEVEGSFAKLRREHEQPAIDVGVDGAWAEAEVVETRSVADRKVSLDEVNP